MLKNRSLIILFLFLLVFGLVFAGCGGDQSSEEGTESEGQETASSWDGTFIVARSTDGDLIDPGYAWSEGDMDIVFHLFDGLVQFKNNDLEVEPALATEWETSENGKTWTFKLREGVKFHDGTDFNADAVVFSFKRVLDENHPFYGVVKGGWSYLDYLMGDIIEDVQALDDYTVEIKLKQKFAPFLTYMGYYSEFIVSPSSAEKWGEEFPQHPCGTGPFKFEKWSKDEYIELSANEDYWGEKPEIKKLIFKVVPESSTRLMELQTGEVDVIKAIDPSQISKVRDNDELKMFSIPGANICFLGINTTIEPFNDPVVRRALNHAVDMDKLVDVVYEGAGTRAINSLPPTIFSFDDTAGPYEYDTEKAKQLLAEAGYSDGFDMKLYTFMHARPYVAKPVQVAEVIKSDFEKIGIKVEIVTQEYATLSDVRTNLKYDVCIAGWYDIPYPSNFLKSMSLGGDKTGFKPQELIDLANNALATYDREEQVKYYKELQQKIHEEAPIVPIAHGNYTAAARNNVKGFELDIIGTVRMHKAYKE